MSINQITIDNTFGQLVTTVAALVAVANNFTDGPQSQTGSTWTFTNANVGVNVLHTLITSNANVGILNTTTGNITHETVGTSNISTANVTTLNVTNETVQNLFVTTSNTVNANIIHLELTVANVFSANIESANIGTVAITTLSVAGLTVSVLNASFANITTLSVTGTSQHNALIATLLTTDNANVRIINVTDANVTNETVGRINASTANITSLNVGSQNISSANITTLTGLATLNSSFANITSANITTVNIAQANIVQMTGTTITTLNVSSANITTITSNTLMSFDPSANLHIATKHYVDTGAGANLVNKLSFNAKGDIVVGTGANTYATQNTGTNGQVIIVDTNQITGIRYSDRASQMFRGLSMGTSSADKVANGNQIIVYRLEEAAMDDGEVVTGWPDRSVIDITANGAGFLDTGVVLANTWYEVYAIRKRSDGTKNFVLHRALDRNVDQNTTNTVVFAYNATVQVNRVTSPNVRVAQSFIANTAGPLTSLEIQVFRTATATGNMWLTLAANTAGNPDSNTLATSRKYDCARAQTAHMNVRFVFDVTANVVAGNSYFWIYNVDQAASDTNFMTLQGSTTVYANGVVKGNNGTSWVALAPGVGALTFKTYQEANSTSLTFPTGYDQKCLIGYVATDQASKLREFRQRDRVINTYSSYQWMGYASKQVTQPECADLTTVVPPIQCDVVFQASQASGGINFAHIGLLDAIDIPPNASSPPYEGRGVVMGGAGTQGSIAYAPFSPFWIEQQAMMVHVGVAVTKFYVVSFTF